VLVSEPSANNLIEMAKTLPPIVNDLIECRLGDDGLQADLSQQILTTNEEPEILMNHLETMAKEPEKAIYVISPEGKCLKSM
jgi:hypothetical protein